MKTTGMVPPALARIKDVRRDASPLTIAIPAYRALICEDCGFVSESQHGSMACGKCSSKATLWLSQLIHVTGQARRSA